MSKHRQHFWCALLMAAATCGSASAEAPPMLPTAEIPIALPPPPPPPPSSNLVTYTGFVVTDVSVNGVLHHNAAVTLSFVGNKADVVPFSVTEGGVTGSGWKITKGAASVQIISGSQVIRANFAPGQILVALDQNNSGFGFSSIVGNDRHLEAAYPLGIDGTVNSGGLNDLVTPVVQTGRQWSCIGFPPAGPGKTGRCGDPAVYPLQTDHGPFVIYMPYFVTNAAGLIDDNYEGAINKAIFTIQVP